MVHEHSAAGSGLEHGFPRSAGRPVRLPAVFVRGGTSKALLLHERDLAGFDAAQREAIILAALGSPDPYGRQIDGLGGGISSTSKVGIIGGPTPDGFITFAFGQVDVERPIVEFRGTCGNISAAIGPFAVDEGLVPAVEPITRVPVLSTTSGQRFIAHVPVAGGRARSEGEYEIDGVPGTGARIGLEFLEPGGSLGRGLLPTGQPRQTLRLGDGRHIEVSLVDAANPLVLVRAEAIDADATLSPEALERDRRVFETLEEIRALAAVALGLASSVQDACERVRATPKVAMVAPPARYTTTRGRILEADQVDLVARMLSMSRVHRTYALTAAIATAVAAAVPETVAWQVCRPGATTRDVRIGHPAGTIEVGATVTWRHGAWQAERAMAYRTARRIMDGWIEVPETYLRGEAWFQRAKQEVRA